jgi:hypothetical protein
MTALTDSVLAQVAAERAAQTAKHGDQSHVPSGTGPQTTPVAEIVRGDANEIVNRHFAFGLANQARAATNAHAAAGAVTFADILLEEVFEALAESDPARLRAELVQVAAVAVQWVEAIDRRGCTRCNAARHLCPGCGVDVEHGQVACAACSAPEPITTVEQLLAVPAERLLRSSQFGYGPSWVVTFDLGDGQVMYEVVGGVEHDALVLSAQEVIDDHAPLELVTPEADRG